MVFRARIKHPAADALFCLSTTEENNTSLEDDLPILADDVTENEKDIYVTDATCKVVPSLIAEPLLANNTPLCKKDMVLEQANNSYYKIAAAQVGHPNFEFTVDIIELLIRNFLENERKQILISSPLRNLTLYLFHYPSVAKHTGRRRMCDTIRQKYHWSNMTNNVYMTVAQ